MKRLIFAGCLFASTLSAQVQLGKGVQIGGSLAGSGVTAAQVQQQANTYAADTGAANAYAIAQSPAPTLVAGSRAVFKAAHANTGASTLVVNGGGAIAIQKSSGGSLVALASGDIIAGQIVELQYDGTVWQITSGAGGGGGGCTSLAGDVTGPCGGNTVTKVNGGSLPISQGFTGTDSSGKIIPSPYIPYQTPPITGSLATNVLADYNYLQQTGTVLTDISGALACSGSPCNGTLGSGGAAPTWLSNGLQFASGVDQNVSLPATINTGKTFVSIFYYSPVNTTPGGPIYNPSYTPLISSSLGTAGINFIFNSPTGNSPETYAEPAIWNSSLITESLNFKTGLYVLAHILGTGGGNLDKIYFNGIEVPYQVQGSTAGAQTSGNLFIGSSGVGPWAGTGGQFTLYRTRIYSDQKSAADLQALTQIFLSDVATRGVPVTPQPASIGTPLLHAIGDSLTVGTGVTTAYPSLLTLTNQPAYTIKNWGIGGIDLQTLTASEPNRVAKECQPTVGGPAVALIWAGTNDFIQFATVTQVFNALGGEVAVLKQAGCLVFVSTMIDRQQSFSLNTQKNAYNDAIRTGVKALGADGIFDIAANPLLGANGASTNLTYFNSDQVHWNNTGEALGVLEVNNALNYYFGANSARPTIITATTATLTADQGYVNVQPTGNTTLTLPSCLGQTGAIYTINMQGANSLTIKNAASSELINGTDYSSTGLVSLAGAGTVTFIDVANPSAAAGCHWDTEAAPGASGGGNTISTSLTAPKLPKANGANSIVDSSISDNGTIVTIGEPVTITTGSGLGGGFDGTEGTAHTGASSFDELWADSTAHRLKMNNNNGGAFFIPGISSAATAGHIATYASNGIDIVDGGAVPTGAVASVTATNSTLTISPTTGAVLAGLNIANANIWTGTQSINLTGSTHPTLPASTIDFTANVNGSSTRRVSSAFGATAFFSTLRADGTAASPTQVLAGEQIGGINAWAFNNASTYNGPIASMRQFADENQTATAAGSRMDFITTPDGSTTAVSRLSIEADGGVIITGLTPGTGSICPNGTGGRLVNSGCAGGSGVTSVTGTANQISSTGGTTPVLSLPSAITFPGTTLTTQAGAASASAITETGALFTGGTATTTFPYHYYNCSGATAVTQFLTAGTVIGINTCSGFAGAFLSFFANGSNSVFNVTSNGTTNAAAFNNNAGSATISSVGTVKGTLFATFTNCTSSASPAVCAAAPVGTAVIAATATTVQVNTTAVTANSIIQLTFDSSLGTKLSVTCTTTPSLLSVSARTAGSNFTVTTAAPAVNPACFSYTITN